MREASLCVGRKRRHDPALIRSHCLTLSGLMVDGQHQLQGFVECAGSRAPKAPPETGPIKQTDFVTGGLWLPTLYQTRVKGRPLPWIPAGSEQKRKPQGRAPLPHST